MCCPGDYNNLKNKSGVIVLTPGQESTSLMLTKPLVGGGTHGGGDIFLNTMDPDYQTFLNWILDGAQNN